MKITVIAVGKLKERYWRDACFEYLKRLAPYATVTVKEVSDRDPDRCGGVAAALSREGKDILGVLTADAHCILLAIDGKPCSSEDIASLFEEAGCRSVREIAFVIGGSHGVSDEVIAASTKTMSFGKITLPHNLARVVLLEQIYRAFKIVRKEPYHK